MTRLLALSLSMLLFPSLCIAGAGDTPEIQRAPASPQAVGALHTLRTIPEACTRLEGMFTGDAGSPYRMTTAAARSGCQSRARFIEGAALDPSISKGWILNDLIRVPSQRCPDRHAVVRVWRKPGKAVPPELDGHGRSRLYLDDARKAHAHGGPVSTPAYAATVEVQGACP